MLSKSSIVMIILFIAALGILVAFQLWGVAAAMLLLFAAFVIRDISERSRLQKIESRLGIVQVSGEEFKEKVVKALGDTVDSIGVLRVELRQIADNVENRIASLEQRAQSQFDTQKYYDLVQKIIDIENRVGAIANKGKEEPRF